MKKKTLFHGLLVATVIPKYSRAQILIPRQASLVSHEIVSSSYIAVTLQLLNFLLGPIYMPTSCGHDLHSFRRGQGFCLVVKEAHDDGPIPNIELVFPPFHSISS